MSLHRQLLLGVSALFFAVLLGIEAIYLANARAQLERQLASTAQEAATALALRLGMVRDLRDAAAVESTINPLFDRGYFREIRLQAPGGETLARRTLAAAPGDVPGWFTEAFTLNPAGAQSMVSSGWRET